MHKELIFSLGVVHVIATGFSYLPEKLYNKCFHNIFYALLNGRKNFCTQFLYSANN